MWGSVYWLANPSSDIAAELFRGYVGQAEGAYLSPGDQLGHGSDGLLDRDSLAAVVQVVQVDRFNAKPSQAGRDPFAAKDAGVEADRACCHSRSERMPAMRSSPHGQAAGRFAN